MKAATILYFAVGALALSRRQEECTANGEECTNTNCCTDSDYECKLTVDATTGELSSLVGNTCQLKTNIAPLCLGLLDACGLDIDGNEINVLGCCAGTSCLADPSGSLFSRGEFVPKSCQADDTSSSSTTTDDSATSTTASATDSATTTTDSASTTTGTCDAGAGSCSKNSDCCSNNCEGLLEPILEPILDPLTGDLLEPVENLLGTCVPLMTSTTTATDSATTTTDSATTATDEMTMTTTTDAATTTPANCEVEAKPCNYAEDCCSYECIPNEHAPVYFRRGGEHEYFSGTCKPYHPVEAPYYPTETSYSGCPYPTTYEVKPTEYATTIVYEHSTATVTVCPTVKPAPTYPAKETVYTEVYVTYIPVTKTEPAPTTYATVSTVTVTVQPSMTACPSKPAASPAAPADTHPAPYSAPAAPAYSASASPAAPADASPAAPGAVQQIADGQVQSPAGGANASPVQQIADGQLQNPAAPAPAAPAYGGKASNGTASPSAPQTYTGAAGKQIASFGAVVLGAVVAAL
ncbi:hypothetical protein TI39_contig4102g00003 [Zymoseptoria brevis]|uniref:Uncharacterized protein n=1 Tax=Zymoseptoria brevis TaxID=1047168 RepID=A0A0F4GE27_9PEZI|nr:hypothetical protein TI39_contig4102g00003 [Zymoseptoria brevis]